jgi:hypothetical protein
MTSKPEVNFPIADHSTKIRELSGRERRTTSMRPFILFAIACLCSCPATAQTRNQGSDNKAAAKQAQWPLQLEMRVPFEPTAFPSGGHVYLMYELHLTNFMPMPGTNNRLTSLVRTKDMLLVLNRRIYNRNPLDSNSFCETSIGGNFSCSPAPICASSLK